MDPRKFIAFSYGISWLTLGVCTYAVAALLKWNKRRKRSAKPARDH